MVILMTERRLMSPPGSESVVWPLGPDPGSADMAAARQLFGTVATAYAASGPPHWCADAAALDGRGRIVRPASHAARSFCLLSALASASGAWAARSASLWPGPARDEAVRRWARARAAAVRLLARVVAPLVRGGPVDSTEAAAAAILAWSLRPGRTVFDAVQLLRRARNLSGVAARL